MASKKKNKRRGGWPKRERWEIMVRVAPEVDAWYRAAAEGSSRSKSGLCESVLTVVARAVEKLESHDAPPEIMVQSVGRAVCVELARLGVLAKYGAAAFGKEDES